MLLASVGLIFARSIALRVIQFSFVGLGPLLVRLFDAVLFLAVWSWILGAIFGEGARKVITAFWLGVFKLLGQILYGRRNR